ncbi:MAG: AI-2E family transporter [Chloroflexota bacterium]
MDTAWSNTTRIVVILLALALGVWLAFAISPLVDALLVAALLAYLLDPAVRWIIDHSNATRTQAAASVFLLTMFIIVAIPAAVGTFAVNSIGRLGSDLLEAVEQIETWLLQPIPIFGFHLQPQQLSEPLEGIGTSILATLPAGSLSILSSVTTNLLWVVAVLAMFYYFLKDGPKIKPWLVTLAPENYRPEYARLLDEIDEVWGKFLRIQLLMFFVIFILMAIGTLLIVGLFRFGLLRWSPLGFIALLLLLYTAIQQLDNLWIRPHILGKQLRLHPGVVFAGLVGALMVSGLLGVLLVVPLLATVKVVGRYIHCKLLGVDPWPAPAAQPAGEAMEGVASSPEPDQEKEHAYQP